MIATHTALIPLTGGQQVATQIFLCLGENPEKSIFWILNLIFDDFIVFYAQKLIRLPILVTIGALLRFGLVLATRHLLVTRGQQVATRGAERVAIGAKMRVRKFL